MNETKYDIRLFAELYDVHPQAIVWLTPIRCEDGQSIIDFAFTYSNDEGLRYLNLTRDQLEAGLFISNSPTLTPTLRKQFLEEMIRVYHTGIKSETALYNPALNKYSRVLRTKLREGVLSIVQDRTAEQQTIRQLEEKTKLLEERNRQVEEQRTLLDNIMKNSSNGISVSQVFRDEQGKVVDALTVLANDAAVRFVGLPREIYLSKRATEIEPAIINSPYYRACINTLETGEPFMMQYQMQSTGRWLELTVSKLDDDHLIHVFTDVTPIKEVQLALERSASQLHTIINRTQSGILAAEPVTNEMGEITDFRFVLVNKSLATYVHQEPEALVGEPGGKWFPAYLTNGLFDLFRDTYLNNRVNRIDHHYNADGIDAWIDMMCTRFDNEVLVTFTDYTPVKKLQLKLEQTVEELKRSNKSLEEFAYAASHDLKEPVRKIRVFSDRLKQLLAGRNEKEEIFFLGRVENAAERMEQLVNDLLDYTLVSQDSSRLEEINLNAKLQRVLEDLELTIQEKLATIKVAPLPTIRGYRRQLQQLFQNLISNALKYSQPDTPPFITVSSRIVQGEEASVLLPEADPECPYHLIEVADNGIGFEQENALRIFDVFTRLHGRSEYAGTGIGLSIARKVVVNHNGFIWAESEPGKGATFKILLPA